MAETPMAAGPERMRDVGAELAAVRADIDELLRAVRRVGQQVHWLMDDALMTADAPICDLDGDVHEMSVELAATVDRGWHYQHELLDGVTRQQLQLAVDRHAEWRRRVDDQYVAVLALSESVVGDDAAAAARAAEQFPAAAQTLLDMEANVPRLEAAAELARRRAADDDAMRREHTKDIKAGADAWEQLCRRLRAVIEEGVAKHALFPVWFRDSLGLVPPPDHPDQWFELATEIRAYRITYGVVAGDSPLGAPPADDSARRRQEWYRRLSAGLARLT